MNGSVAASTKKGWIRMRAKLHGKVRRLFTSPSGNSIELMELNGTSFPEGRVVAFIGDAEVAVNSIVTVVGDMELSINTWGPEGVFKTTLNGHTVPFKVTAQALIKRAKIERSEAPAATADEPTTTTTTATADEPTATTEQDVARAIEKVQNEKAGRKRKRPAHKTKKQGGEDDMYSI